MSETSLVLPGSPGGLNACAEIALVESKGKNYIVHCGNGASAVLKRDVDFAKVPKAKSPSLLKSGAEKICMGYGLLQQYSIESKIERFDGANPFAMYVVRCDLVKVYNGMQYVFSCAYGSANTGEKRNGFNSAYDSANSALKMAQKRALVSAAIAISGLSDAFTQDMENETFMEKAKDLVNSDDPNTPVTTAQIRRLYAVGADAGLTANEVKQKLAAEGITSTKQILQKDYNGIIDMIKGTNDA